MNVVRKTAFPHFCFNPTRQAAAAQNYPVNIPIGRHFLGSCQDRFEILCGSDITCEHDNKPLSGIETGGLIDCIWKLVKSLRTVRIGRILSLDIPSPSIGSYERFRLNKNSITVTVNELNQLSDCCQNLLGADNTGCGQTLGPEVLHPKENRNGRSF